MADRTYTDDFNRSVSGGLGSIPSGPSWEAVPLWSGGGDSYLAKCEDNVAKIVNSTFVVDVGSGDIDMTVKARAYGNANDAGLIFEGYGALLRLI